MLPPLQPAREKRETQNNFRGYVDRLNAGNEEFTAMINMSSDEAPMLAPRKKRRRIRQITGQTLLGGAALSWVDEGQLYFNGQAVAQGVSADAQLVRMGAYLIAWPDRIIYNTHTGELMDMDCTWTGSGVRVRPCTLSGAELSYVAGDDEPENPADQMYWLNTAVNAMYQYLGGVWTGIDSIYSRIECLNIGKGFKDYDVVSIAGMEDEHFNLDAATVYTRGDDYLVISTGIITDFVNEGPVTITREAPQLDRIVENNNRLWGYSNLTHEIRCTKLGDPTNWNAYLGLSSDSYAATVGSQGDFTGICNYMGYVHFFKENRVHRLYGTQPSNFQLVELSMRGVKTGCEKSLCVVNELLYYMSRDGIIRYDGSAPVGMSEPLGEHDFSAAVCGAHGDKLYLSILSDGSPRLFVLDTRVYLWHAEDNLRAVAIAGTPEGDFILDDTGVIWGIDGASTPLEDADADEEADFAWMAVTGDMTADSRKIHTTMTMHLRRLEVRLSMERGAKIDIDIQFDSQGPWKRVLSYRTEIKKTIVLPMAARSCDHMRLRYSGTGRAVVYAVTKLYASGEEKPCLNYRA